MSHSPGPPSNDDDQQANNPYPEQQGQQGQQGQEGQQPSYPPPPGYGQHPGYGQQPGYPGQGAPAGGPPPSTNGKALASLITGIGALVLAFCSCGLGGLVGIVALFLGLKGRSDIRSSAGRQGGEGVALGGIITGVLATLIGVLAVAFWIWVVATGNADFNTDPTEPYGDQFEF